MKFMTFNVQHGKNYLTKKIDLPLMADTSAGCRADVIGLNEVYGKGAVFCDQPGALAKYLGEKTGDRWESFFAKAISLSGGPYGNGLVSRYPILHPEVILLKSPPPTHPGYYEDRCILKAGIDLPQGEMTVLICHFGLQPEEASLAANTLASLLDEEKAKGRPAVLMGDFNLSPCSPLLAPIYERMTDTDLFCKGDHLTFPSDKPEEKIDYIFVSPGIPVTAAEVPEIVASDHRPVTVEIEMPL